MRQSKKIHGPPKWLSNQAVHDRIMKNVQEVGDCLEWMGYFGNKVPQLYISGQMLPVRRIVRQLKGAKLHAYYGVKCGNPACVANAHILGKSNAQHLAAMGASQKDAPSWHVKRHKIAETKRKTAKLDMDKATEIRGSEESYSKLAAKYGVTKAMIGRIKRQQSWRMTSGLFSGLMR